MSDVSNDVTIIRHEGWAEIAINRPDRRNAIIPPVSHGIRGALHELEKDESVAVVLLRGEGGFFCSGIDLKALQADPPPPWKNEKGNSWRDLHLALFHFTKPIVGAFEKYGINAGAALAMACDILVTGETAFLQVGEIQQGAMAPMNAAWLKIKTTEQVIARLTLYGDRVPGPRLVEMGLAAECVPDDQVLPRCIELCERLASFPPGAAQNIKRMIIDQREIHDPESFFKQPVSNALASAGLLKN